MTIRIGIIGGSGLYQNGGADIRPEVEVETPFGKASDCIGRHSRRQARAFLARHHRNHTISPSELNFARISTDSKSWREWILSASAVGSLKEELKRWISFCDQFYDRTRTRISTFFGDGFVAQCQVSRIRFVAC